MREKMTALVVRRMKRVVKSIEDCEECSEGSENSSDEVRADSDEGVSKGKEGVRRLRPKCTGKIE